MEFHLDVPQYMAIPWLITWVIALTVSTIKIIRETKSRKKKLRSSCHEHVTSMQRTSMLNTPTFYRRVGIRSICENHINVLQLKSLQGRPQTCSRGSIFISVEIIDFTRHRRHLTISPSIMCFLDKPLSISALEQTFGFRTQTVQF